MSRTSGLFCCLCKVKRSENARLSYTRLSCLLNHQSRGYTQFKLVYEHFNDKSVLKVHGKPMQFVVKACMLRCQKDKQEGSLDLLDSGLSLSHWLLCTLYRRLASFTSLYLRFCIFVKQHNSWEQNSCYARITFGHGSFTFHFCGIYLYILQPVNCTN